MLVFWAGCACVLVGRAVQLQVVQHDFLADQGDIRNLRVEISREARSGEADQAAEGPDSKRKHLDPPELLQIRRHQLWSPNAPPCPCPPAAWELRRRPRRRWRGACASSSRSDTT